MSPNNPSTLCTFWPSPLFKRNKAVGLCRLCLLLISLSSISLAGDLANPNIMSCHRGFTGDVNIDTRLTENPYFELEICLDFVLLDLFVESPFALDDLVVSGLLKNFKFHRKNPRLLFFFCWLVSRFLGVSDIGSLKGMSFPQKTMFGTRSLVVELVQSGLKNSNKS